MIGNDSIFFLIEARGGGGGEGGGVQNQAGFNTFKAG